MFINATCYKLLISFIIVNLTFTYKEISPLMYTCVKLNGGDWYQNELQKSNKKWHTSLELNSFKI